MEASRWAAETSPKRAPSTQHNPDESHPLDLTLGIEIELLLLYQRNPETNNQVGSPTQIHHENCLRGFTVVESALQRPVRVRCITCSQLHEYAISVQLKLPGEPGEDVDNAWSRWTVTEDGSLNLHEMKKQPQFYKHAFNAHGFASDQHCEYYQVEVQSRVLRPTHPILTTESAEKTHRHQITYEDEIRAVFNRLNEFNTAAGPPGFRVLINESCGLHVHVGNENKSFPLQTAKNIFALCAANEKEMDSMHAADRINGTDVALHPNKQAEIRFTERPIWWHEGNLNMPLSTNFAHIFHAHRNDLTMFKDQDQVWPLPRNVIGAGAEIASAIGNHDMASWQKVLHLCPSSDALQTLQRSRDGAHPGHHSNVNFDNTLPYDPTGQPWSNQAKVTVEFRQHTGTLDSKAALAWVDVLLRLVKYAHSLSAADVKTDVETIWQDSKYTTLHFLQKLGYGRKHWVFRHYKNVLGLRRETAEGGSTSYASKLREREIKREEKLRRYEEREEQESILHDLVIWNAEQTFRRTNPDAVRERIQEKLVRGCYGQFEANFLDVLSRSSTHNFTEKEKRVLTAGGKPPLAHALPPYDPSEEPFWAEGERGDVDNHQEEIDHAFSDDEDEQPGT